MHEHHVGIAAARYVERLASATGDNFNVDAGLLLEQGKDETEQPGILRRSRRGNHDGFLLGRGERDLRKGTRNRKRDQPVALGHGISPVGEPWLSGPVLRGNLIQAYWGCNLELA